MSGLDGAETLVAGWRERAAGRPILLDLFCGGGGCSRGYQQAGFWVAGVDHLPQKRYCGDAFVQADALAAAERLAPLVDAVHASPPCQA